MAILKKRKAQKKAQKQLGWQRNTAPPDKRLIIPKENEQNEDQDPQQEQTERGTYELPITQLAISEAAQRLKKYKSGKSNLEKRIKANEEYWKLRQWDYINDKGIDSNYKINTAWLWNCISAKHADLMDGFPESNIRAKREDDVKEAEKLKSIIPVIYEENNYEMTYSDLCSYILKKGGCCAGVFWDGTLHDGLGDISIKRIDLLELFWETGVKDIQDSREVFKTSWEDNDTLIAKYPQLEGKLGGKTVTVEEYRTDDKIDYNNKSIVVDWYYKKVDENGNQILHLCQFVEGEVLFASENEPEKYPNGWYDHGKYPFVITSLFPVEGSIIGYSYTDIGRGDQNAIDILTSAILSNAVETSTARYFSRLNSGINESEFLDPSKRVVHVAGNLDEDTLREIPAHAMSGYVINMRDRLIDEMKESLGNRDVSNGGSVSGVTAASAIAAMQEQSGKLSRVHNKTMYNMHRQITDMVIEYIRQFYDNPREYRITGKTGEEEYVTYDNSGLQPQPLPPIAGIEMGLRLPCFDIEVSAQKQNPYTKMEQNELALQLYNAGVFAPQNSDNALALLQFMDFEHKDEVVHKVQENGTLLMKYQQLQKIAFDLAQLVDPAMAEQLAQAILMENGTEPAGAPVDPNALSGNPTTAEPSFMENARAKAQEVTQV